jgi:hypothetical protein
MGERLSAVYILYQGIKLDYCFEESMRASLDLCDDIYINEGGSTDGTRDVLASLETEYGKDRIRIYDRKWVHDRGFWARERNFLLDEIPKESYVINLGADECMHEKDFENIRDILPKLGHNRALQYHALHFYALPTYYIQGPAWAKVLTKTWRNDSGIKYLNRPGGCADDPLWPNGQPVHFARCVNIGAVAYHYGHCRHPRAVETKNQKAHSLYRGEDKYADGSFPDIKKYDYQLDVYLERGGVKPFIHSHPKYMEDWVDRHKNQPTRWPDE